VDFRRDGTYLIGPQSDTRFRLTRQLRRRAPLTEAAVPQRFPALAAATFRLPRVTGRTADSRRVVALPAEGLRALLRLSVLVLALRARA
jgi:hypothetical protein